MEVTHVFAGLAVTDFDAAHDWYVRLFGRSADMTPHEREAVWTATAGGSVYVVEDPEQAGSGSLTLALSDLRSFEAALREARLAYSELAEGAAPRRLVIRDPDGNTITFFQDPAAPS